MPYTLAYKDRYRRVSESAITSDTSDSVAFALLPDDEPTQLLAEWTGKQFTKLLSSVYMGANLMFPEIANEIVWQLIKVVHQPIEFELPEESGCIEYGTSAGFISYSPDNPFISGDKADGWNKEAWYRWDEFDTLFPDWIDNWLGGLIDAITGYQTGDVLFNIESIPIMPIDAWLSGGGLFPKIEIRFSGTGVVEVGLLSFPLGGKAIIELDQEPNVLDILTGGLLDPSAFMVELNRDIVNFPPDEYPINTIEIPVETSGDHVLYIVYIPILDDSLLPIAFGGGFRSVELCGFEEEAVVMGIESIVWDGCELKSISGGIETVVVTAEQIQACLDIPEGGGGGGGGGTIATVHKQDLGASTVTSTATSAAGVTGASFNHTFTKSKAIVICHAYVQHSGASAVCQIRANVAGATFVDNSYQEWIGTNLRVLAIANSFEDIPLGSRQVALTWFTSGGTMTMNNSSLPQFIIIEFDDASELFVEDIQVLSDGTIQKKIAGVWIDVSVDLATILSSIQSTANAALAAAAAAQTTANNAATVNASQQAQIVDIVNINNTQSTQITGLIATNTAQSAILTAHESRLDDVDLSIAGLNALHSVQASQISTLESQMLIATFGGSWAWLHPFEDTEGGYTASEGTYAGGVGWVSSGATGNLKISNIASALENQITHIEAIIVCSNNLGGGSVSMSIGNGSTDYTFFRGVANGVESKLWMRVPNPIIPAQLYLNFEGLNIDFVLKSLRYIGRGSNSPFD